MKHDSKTADTDGQVRQTERAIGLLFTNWRQVVYVHVQSPDGVSKFWLEPIIALADAHLLSARELTRIEGIVKEHQDDFVAAWRRHFTV